MIHLLIYHAYLKKCVLTNVIKLVFTLIIYNLFWHVLLCETQL